MIHPRSGKLGFLVAKQSCPSQVCTQACLIPGALEWQLQVESWESGSITVLERTFLQNVVPLLGSCFLVSQTVLQGDRACPLPHHTSLCISFYFGVPVLWGIWVCQKAGSDSRAGLWGSSSLIPYFITSRQGLLKKKLPVDSSCWSSLLRLFWLDLSVSNAQSWGYGHPQPCLTFYKCAG